MAWAIEIPNDGKFVALGGFLARLDGKELPWDERLEYAWYNELTEEQKGFLAYHGEAGLYAGAAASKFGDGAARPEICGPIWEHEIPHVLVLDRPKPSILPLTIPTLNGLMLNEMALEVWRSLEPEANFVYPLEVRTKRGKVYEGPFYGVAVTQLRDALLLDRTPHKAEMIGHLPNYEVIGWLEGEGRMAVSEESRGGAHLWLDRRFAYPRLFMSDELREAFVAADVPLPKIYRIEEV